MKRILLIAVISGLFASLYAQNQTAYDAALGTNNELNGTARFVAVGGAMGALGGDASTTSYNPAGIGVYRSSELTISGNLHWTNTTMGSTPTANHIDGNLANVAYIGTWLNPSNKGLVTLNFGITYNRLKNFSREGRYEGTVNHSMSQFITKMTQGVAPQNFNSTKTEQFNNPNLRWSSVLGYQAYLFDIVDNETNYLSYYDKIGGGSVKNNIQFTEQGSNNEYGLSVGGNVENIFYWGMSFNCDYLTYRKRTIHQEKMADGKSFTLNNIYDIEGCGFSYKVGIIIRPTNWLRIGGAFHTPTWYKIDERMSASISYNKVDNSNFTETPVATGQFYLQSPLSALGSLGFVLGKFGFIGIDYQYSNTPYMTIEDSRGNTPIGSDGRAYINESIKQTYTDTHSFRIGMELKPIESLALRLGGGYTLPNTHSNASRLYYNNDTRCDVDFYNNKDAYNVTAGIGYRIDRHAIDLAYVWQVNHADYYAYQDVAPISMRSVRNQLILTYGIRF